ncbi:DUF302 domain-containing protein [Jannaschia sp. Os4]|uniref:DUF302 domain-containing protein n=1 Tax=Jannaschia sp. Os4 TaxID=2807617 RepID=UPI00193ACAF9|nr:DUF302 domain-containing protein [Jannaschia sp. Os4]MBM2576578.1 DUF302 domain-containing protein [Jannaschia sp. Os4]
MLRPLALLLSLAAAPLAAQEVADMAPRDGWVVRDLRLGFDEAVDAVRDAARAAGLAVVTQAGPTGAAAARGIEIPGNRALGLYNNDFAVRLLRLSTPAMIEAPLRVYVTEDADGDATVSHVIPSVRLAPYREDSADPAAFDAVAAELDAAFAAVMAGLDG